MCASKVSYKLLVCHLSVRRVEYIYCLHTHIEKGFCINCLHFLLASTTVLVQN